MFRLPAYEIPEAQRTAKGQPIINFVSLAKEESIEAILDISCTKGKHFALVSKKAIIKRVDFEDLANIRSSGLIVMKPKENDELGWVLATNGEDKILIVSKKGKAIQFFESDVRVMGRAAAGVRGMRIGEDDAVVEVDVVDSEAKFVFTVTENGMGKLSSIEDYREQGRGGSGVKAGSMTTKTGDIIGVHLITETARKEGEVILISRSGQTVRVPLGTIRVTSRVTQGVILAKLKDKKDAFTSMTVTTKAEEEGIESGEDEQAGLIE